MKCQEAFPKLIIYLNSRVPNQFCHIVCSCNLKLLIIMIGGNCNCECEGGLSSMIPHGIEQLVFPMLFAYACDHSEGSKVLLPSMQLLKYTLTYFVVIFK